MRNFLLLPIISMLFFCSCENFEWFKSEKGIKKELEATWDREFLTDTTLHEFWFFKEGKLTVTKVDGNDTLSNATVDYSLDAGITNSYLKTNTFQTGDYNQNLKWNIVILDKEVLYLVSEKDGSLLQREFEKK